MASQLVDEECFKKFFENEPKLRSHYFIINSLYDGDRNDALLCDDVIKHSGVSLAEVQFAVNEINHCSPETVIVKHNPSYRGIAITELGKSVLRYDITKTVSHDGIMADDLTIAIRRDLLDKYLSNNWLRVDRSNEDMYMCGDKYCNFVNLKNSLYEYNETNFLTNQEALIEAKWIEIIEGRFEIFCGLKFPSVIEEKLLLLYSLAVDTYNKNVQEIKEMRNKILQDYQNMLRLQKAVEEDSALLDERIKTFKLIYGCY